MKKLFAGLLIGLAVMGSEALATTPISNFGTVPSLTIGGRVFTDLGTYTSGNLLVLGCSNQGTGNRWCTLKKTSDVAGTGYQVTAGKTLYLLAFQALIETANAVGASFCYGDTDVADNSGSAPTTPKYMWNDTSAAQIPANTAGAITGAIENWAIPAAKYGCIFNGGAAVNENYIVYGYEK